MEQNNNLKKDIGLFIATALVTGNMMGSGIFMLPATLAGKAGPGATMSAWLLTAFGSILLALCFASLSRRLPKTGGPYEYSKAAFGEFAGFMNAWLYWNGSWIGNAAVVIAVASYAGKLIPAIGNSNLGAFLFATAVLWIFTFVNIIGVKVAGRIQTAITVFEILLFLFFIVSAAGHFDFNNIMPMFPEGKGMETMPVAATLTLWSFIGLESSSIAAGEIRNPEKNVARSTITGILIAAVMYMAINFFAMGAMPQAGLEASKAPIADILTQYYGSGVVQFLTLGIVVSILGTTIGWLLSTARVAFAAGEDGVFPSLFKKVHPKFKTPHTALIVGSLLVNVLLLMNYAGNKTLASAFDFTILLATLSFLPVYATTAAAEIKYILKEGKKLTILSGIKVLFVPIAALVYSGWAIYGSGFEAIIYGVLLAILGVPVYAYMKIKIKE
jgi:amino acid transporter